MLISSLPGANSLLLEHKIGVFVRFWGLEPLFSGILSTKSAFLCSGRRGLAPGCVNIAFLQITAMQSCGQMLPAELATLPHRPWTPMSSVNGRVPASEAQREGWSEAEVCAEEVVNPQKPLRWRRWARADGPVPKREKPLRGSES